MNLVAVHLAERVVDDLWWLGGFALAIPLILAACYRLQEWEISRLASLTAVFFVATTIHLRLGPTSAHLLLNGAIGILLGKRAVLAIGIGLAMQAVLLGHGGRTTWGLNLLIFSVPALAGSFIFQRWRSARAGLSAGLIAGMVVMLTACLNAMLLVLAGIEDFRRVAVLVVLYHLPLAVVEGLVTGSLIEFIVKVSPEWLYDRAGNSSSSGTSHCPMPTDTATKPRL